MGQVSRASSCCLIEGERGGHGGGPLEVGLRVLPCRCLCRFAEQHCVLVSCSKNGSCAETACICLTPPPSQSGPVQIMHMCQQQVQVPRFARGQQHRLSWADANPAHGVS